MMEQTPKKSLSELRADLHAEAEFVWEWLLRRGSTDQVQNRLQITAAEYAYREYDRFLDRKMAAYKAAVAAELETADESEPKKLPTYHELLDHLCTELVIPGSPTFHEAVQVVKKRLAR